MVDLTRPQIDPDAIRSAFEQLPIALFALEGPELRFVALNREAARDTPLGPGDSVLESQLVESSGLLDALRRVYLTGVPVVADEWPISVPGPDGELQKRYLQFTYGPWRWADGRIRGVVGHTLDVTAAVRHRLDNGGRDGGSSDGGIADLQFALLPADLTVLPGVRLAAHYLVAGPQRTAGGDWYSVLPLPDGRVGLVVGDVVGHGLAACATMGQLRVVLDEQLQRGESLAQALTALDAAATHLPAARGATVCVLALDRATGVLEYCTAGHPAPLVVAAGEWAYLQPTGSGPLGSGEAPSIGSGMLPRGGLLVVYSDGLLERPGVPRSASALEVGRTFADALARASGPAELPISQVDTICDQVMEQLARASGFADDTTVLALARTPAVPGLDRSIAATPVAIDWLTGELDAWLQACGAGEDDLRSLRHALTELVTNSIEHAGAAGLPAALRLAARHGGDGVATVRLSDTGPWKEVTADAEGRRMRGLGLAMSRQLVDGMHVEHGPDGTSVTLRRRLRRPAGATGTARPGPDPSALPGDLRAVRGSGRPGPLLLSGPVRNDDAGRLRDLLDITTRGATRDLTVDLSAVTHLASSGVRVLAQQLRDAADNQTRLTLLARPGSVADQILRLAGLPVAVPVRDDAQTG